MLPWEHVSHGRDSLQLHTLALLLPFYNFYLSLFLPLYYSIFPLYKASHFLHLWAPSTDFSLIINLTTILAQCRERFIFLSDGFKRTKGWVRTNFQIVLQPECTELTSSRGNFIWNGCCAILVSAFASDFRSSYGFFRFLDRTIPHACFSSHTPLILYFYSEAFYHKRAQWFLLSFRYREKYKSASYLSLSFFLNLSGNCIAVSLTIILFPRTSTFCSMFKAPSDHTISLKIKKISKFSYTILKCFL